MYCIVCRNTNHNYLYPDLSIIECDCGHIYYQCDLTQEDLLTIYSKEYFEGEEYSNYLLDKKIIQKNFSNRLRNINKYKNGGNLLEIGSAYGFFLELARENFNTLGFEICKSAAHYASNNLGLNVIQKEFASYTINSSSQFDVICMFDCIEHLQFPDLYIEKIRKLISKDGYLFITTGDSSSLMAKLFGKNWRLIHPPSHIHYFSKYSLSKLLSNYGFEVVSSNYVGTWRSFRQLFAELFGFKNVANIVPGFFYLNTYDIMEVTAKLKVN